MSLAIIPLIILVIFFLIVLTISIVINQISRKVRGFSRQILGTESLSAGLEKMQQEYSVTPKSVSAMTSLYLPKIKNDFPEFQYDEMKQRMENVLCSYLLAIDRNDPQELREGSAELRQKLKMHIDMLRDKGQNEHFEKIKLHRTEILEYRKRDGRCIITFQSALQYHYYLTEAAKGIIAGSADILTQSKFNVDVIYIQNREKADGKYETSVGMNCPNCGAPIGGLGHKVCEYCGTPVIELNIYVWSFSDVRVVR